MPATKAPSTVWTPIAWVISAMTPITTRIVVMTGTSLTRLSLAQRIKRNTRRRPIVKLAARNKQRAEDALRERTQFDGAVPGEAEDDREDDPAERIVDDRGGHDDLAERAPHEVHLADRHRDDLDRRDRQRRAEEQRRDQAMIGVRQHAVGQELADQNAAQERHRDPGERNAECGAAGLADQREVGFHPGQQQQHQDAELPDGADHAALLVGAGKQRVLQSGGQRAKDARPEQNPGKQLAHDRRLADPLHRLAQEPPAYEEHDDLGKEHHLGGRGLACLGRQRGRQQGKEQRQSHAGAPSAGYYFSVAPGHSAVAAGAGNDFLPSIGHQCTALVMGPGGCRFGDYWHLGPPLSLLVVEFGVPLILIFCPPIKVGNFRGLFALT